MKIIILTFILISAYSFCAYANDKALPNTVGKILELTINDNNREIQINVGEAISVKLKIQGGTGYNWYIDRLDETHLKLVGTETKEISPKNIIGGPVLGILSFKAIAPGDTILRLLYYRVWEGKEHAIKKFEVKLHIADKK